MTHSRSRTFSYLGNFYWTVKFSWDNHLLTPFCTTFILTLWENYRIPKSLDPFNNEDFFDSRILKLKTRRPSFWKSLITYFVTKFLPTMYRNSSFKMLVEIIYEVCALLGKCELLWSHRFWRLVKPRKGTQQQDMFSRTNKTVSWKILSSCVGQ